MRQCEGHNAKAEKEACLRRWKRKEDQERGSQAQRVKEGLEKRTQARRNGWSKRKACKGEGSRTGRYFVMGAISALTWAACWGHMRMTGADAGGLTNELWGSAAGHSAGQEVIADRCLGGAKSKKGMVLEEGAGDGRGPHPMRKRDGGSMVSMKSRRHENREGGARHTKEGVGGMKEKGTLIVGQVIFDRCPERKTIGMKRTKERSGGYVGVRVGEARKLGPYSVGGASGSGGGGCGGEGRGDGGAANHGSGCMRT